MPITDLEMRMTIKTLADKGVPSREIARQLSVAEGIVRYHLHRPPLSPYATATLRPTSFAPSWQWLGPVSSAKSRLRLVQAWHGLVSLSAVARPSNTVNVLTSTRPIGELPGLLMLWLSRVFQSGFA